jgi:hypothetical protein
MLIFDQVASKIIKEQELVIGPMAWDEARKLSGLSVLSSQTGEVSISAADPKTAIDQLVGRFERLFGRASQEVCKEAAAPLLISLLASEVPVSLRA